MLSARLLAAAGVLTAIAAPARAQRVERVVAVAPLTTLGSEDSSPATRALTAQIEAALAAVPGTRVIRAAQVAAAVRAARRPALRACEGEPACLAGVGALVGAELVVAGEVGGVGDARIAYLAAVEVAGARELRSTTLALAARGQPAADDGARGAAVRLLDPAAYRGALQLAVDVAGATIFVDGARTTPDRSGEIPLAVGTHAVRVTHPAYRDFVRFLDVRFATTTAVPVALQQFPVVARDLRGDPVSRDRVIVDPPPWWRRWYVVAPGAVGLAVATAVVVGLVVRERRDLPCHAVGGDGGC